MNVLRRLFGGKPKPQQARPVLPIIELPKSKGFPMEVVGESYYQSNFERICGPRSKDGENRIVEAWLILEDSNPHDSEAVLVEINGMPVGHLSREVAPKYRQWLTANGHGRAYGKCQGKIKGGWQRGRNDIGSYGVTLNVKLK